MALSFYIHLGVWALGSILWQIVVVMANIKKEEPVKWLSVKLPEAIVEKVRRSKEVTGVPVSTFFEQAAEEKLAKQKGKSK